VSDICLTLDRLAIRINRWYPNVNLGGCCVFAVIVAEELRARVVPMGIAFSVATSLIFCCTFLAYLNGYRSSEITR